MKTTKQLIEEAKELTKYLKPDSTGYYSFENELIANCDYEAWLKDLKELITENCTYEEINTIEDIVNHTTNKSEMFRKVIKELEKCKIPSETLSNYIEDGNNLLKMIEDIPFNNIIEGTIQTKKEAAEYRQWIEDYTRFLCKEYADDYTATELLNKKNIYINNCDTVSEQIAKLKSIKKLPQKITNPQKQNTNSTQPSLNLTINQTNTQSQKQSVSININNLKHELQQCLSKEDFNKLIEAIKCNDKNSTKQKIKGWLGDTLSNITAALLTNPELYNFFKSLIS